MTAPAPLPAPLPARWFDGRHGRAQAVTVSLQHGWLHFGDRRERISDVGWPERSHRGQRLIRLRSGGVLSFPDAAAFDAWAAAAGHQPGWAERWQLSGHRALVALLLVSALLAGGWHWGLPWAGDRLLAAVPPSAEQTVGEQAMALFDRHWLRPSRLAAAEQQAWRARVGQMLARARAAGLHEVPPQWQLHFRGGGAGLGPNAFALPGGHLCVTDELLELLHDEPDAVLTIVAHELGHVQHRHGLRLGLQASLTAAAVALWLGDTASLLNGLPLVLSGTAYSRRFEREADAYARTLAQLGGVDATRMAVFFERLARQRGPQAESAPAIAFSTHPGDSERIAFFRAAARR